jgi:hypothetical protein
MIYKAIPALAAPRGGTTEYLTHLSDVPKRRFESEAGWPR